MFKKFPSLNEVHDKVNAICLLKYVVHSDNERVVDLKQDKFFNCKALYGLMLNHDVLTNAFHSV